LRGILEGLVAVSESQMVVWPVHPRTRKQLLFRQQQDLSLDRVVLTEPVSYRDMLVLEKSASVILTDSGGVQKEAMWFGVPCVTLRDETEWVETIETGCNELVSCQREKIWAAFEAALRKPRVSIPAEGNGTPASTLIVQHLLAFDGSKAKSICRCA
jgi:UDP-GlcNAc3NAcA epimerase